MSRSRRPSKQTRQRNNNGTKGIATRDFWGSLETVPDVVTTVRPAADASTLVRSLGSPPLAGHETIAEHYFRAVYDKAAGLAIALAAGSGLLAGPGEED